MSGTDNSDLLTPSLGERTTNSIYSVGALIAAAFFGGGPAVAIMGFINSARLGRLRADAVWLALLLFVAVGTVIFMFVYAAGDSDTLRNVRVLNRAVGFGLCGALYLMHRRAFKAMTVLGLDPPSPYVTVIGAVVASVALTIGLAAFFAQRL